MVLVYSTVWVLLYQLIHGLPLAVPVIFILPLRSRRSTVILCRPVFSSSRTDRPPRQCIMTPNFIRLTGNLVTKHRRFSRNQSMYSSLCIMFRSNSIPRHADFHANLLDPETRRWGVVLDRGQWVNPSHQLGVLGERCKLPQRGPRRSPLKFGFWSILGPQK